MKWTLMTVLILACLGIGSSLKCYKCVGGNCNDPFDSAANTASDCGIGAFDACAKVKAAGVVTRSCFASLACEAFGGNNDCYVENDDNAACCCTGDGCNSATTWRVSYVALAAMMFVTKAVL